MVPMPTATTQRSEHVHGASMRPTKPGEPPMAATAPPEWTFAHKILCAHEPNLAADGADAPQRNPAVLRPNRGSRSGRCAMHERPPPG